MQGKASRKIHGGKLLKVSVEYEKGVIVEARICGDFFAHPEDSIERLEKGLKGVEFGGIEDVVGEKLESARLYGVDQKSIVETIHEAIDED